MEVLEGSPSGTAWGAVLLVGLGTLAGVYLARRKSEKAAFLLAVASAMMLVTALADIVPDAWQDASECGLPKWTLLVAGGAGFLVITYFTRKGCGCAADREKKAAGQHAPGRHRRVKKAVEAAVFGGMGTAAALTTHRAIEGATLALMLTIPVVVALVVHSASEGLALATLLAMSKQRLAPWLVVACVSPAVGVLAATIHPLPRMVIPVLLAVVAGVLMRTAVVGMKLAAGKQKSGKLPRRYVVSAATASLVFGAVLVMAH